MDRVGYTTDTSSAGVIVTASGAREAGIGKVR
jgi:hypothetical protein